MSDQTTALSRRTVADLSPDQRSALVALATDASTSGLVGGRGSDAASATSTAMIRIAIGWELGIPPSMALTGIYLIEGRPSIGAGLQAALLRAHPRYDYVVGEWDHTGCTVAITRDDVVVGTYRYDQADAQRAGLTRKSNWVAHPRSMFFARAIVGAIRAFAPDLMMGSAYDPDELEQAGPPMRDVTPRPAPQAQAQEPRIAIPAEALARDARADVPDRDRYLAYAGPIVGDAVAARLYATCGGSREGLAAATRLAASTRDWDDEDGYLAWATPLLGSVDAEATLRAHLEHGGGDLDPYALHQATEAQLAEEVAQ